MYRITVQFHSDSTTAERFAALAYLRRIPGVRAVNFQADDDVDGDARRHATVLVDDIAVSQWFVPEVARLTAVESARADDDVLHI